MKTRTLFVFCIITFLLVLPVFGQDSTPVPTLEAAPPVDTVVTTTTTTTAPVTDIGLTLNWALAFLMLWQAAGIAYAVSVEKTIKPMIYSIVATLTDSTAVRNAVLIVAVIAGAFMAVSAGGINLFASAPFGLFTDTSPSFLLILNSLFIAAGAFIGAETWAALEGWLKKAKAVADVLTSQSARRIAPE